MFLKNMKKKIVLTKIKYKTKGCSKVFSTLSISRFIRVFGLILEKKLLQVY